MDRRLCFARIATCSISQEIWSVHGTRLHRSKILLSDRKDCCCYLSHIRILHIYRWSNARSWNCLLKIFRSRHQYGRYYRYGNRFCLCGARRYEGHHIHPGSSILCSHICLFSTSYIYLNHDYWKSHPTIRAWISNE